MLYLLAVLALLPTVVSEDGNPPLIVIPGLTSSAITYKLTDSKPPGWAFWCNRTTEDFTYLWPFPSDLQLTDFPCWLSTAQSVFDSEAQTIRPLRDGVETDIVDFGSFDGIPGFDQLESLFENFGWKNGETLFAAPFDWRLPSISQEDRLFSSLKALVEKVYKDNGNRKVVLWAFSFGPQFTLSFLHRQTQEWKDKYIFWFIATSPVWSGAPAALISYTSGDLNIGPPAPPAPPECDAFDVYAATCYTGASPADEFKVADLGECCEKIALDKSVLFNYFEANTTCQPVATYDSTYSCPDGILGYPSKADASNSNSVSDAFHLSMTAKKAAADLLKSALLGGMTEKERAEKAAENVGDVGLTPAIIREIARACPAFMWTFPRMGTDPKITYTKDDVLFYTPSKNYTAFDIRQLIKDLGGDAAELDMHELLSNEPDLGSFASPGVDTFVTYGYGINTTLSQHFDGDFKANSAPNVVSFDVEDGDYLVSLRASLRGHQWAHEQAELKKNLYYKGYEGQVHASCFPDPSSSNECATDVLNLILRGIAPHIPATNPTP